ncbi:MAG TPA: hypothetical protein VKA73_13835 [Rubrobacter sp.]|nr:hypothetical protein [Rubrobacter sp.]
MYLEDAGEEGYVVSKIWDPDRPECLFGCREYAVGHGSGGRDKTLVAMRRRVGSR